MSVDVTGQGLDDPTGCELATAAPEIGALGPLRPPFLAAGVAVRTPAVMLDGARVGNFDVAGASLIGAGHSSSGGARQDWYDFACTPGGALVIAVADGLGSRTHSAIGARLFCEGVVQAVTAAPEAVSTAAELLEAGATHAHLVAEGSYGLEDREIAFVAAVAVADPRGTCLARVGDVSAFRFGPDQEVTELFAADDGPINVVVESLPAPAPLAPEVAETEATVLAVVTDGLANDLRTSPGVRAWLSEAWQQARGQFAMADSLRYRRQGSHDDRTAVVLWRDPETSDDGPVGLDAEAAQAVDAEATDR
jgi:hypothetical protein